MSPSGQSNLLLIRRLLHPSIPDFGRNRGRFFAQVLPKFSVVRSDSRDFASALANAWRPNKEDQFMDPRSRAEWLTGDIFLSVYLRMRNRNATTD
jgi:hypothetical protein